MRVESFNRITCSALAMLNLLLIILYRSSHLSVYCVLAEAYSLFCTIQRYTMNISLMPNKKDLNLRKVSKYSDNHIYHIIKFVFLILIDLSELFISFY